VAVRYWAFALLLPAVAIVAASLVHVVAFDGRVEPESTGTPVLSPVPFFEVFLIGGGNGELGRRGFALPRLQRPSPALAASLLLGTVWFLWHPPLFYIRADFHRSIPLELVAHRIVGVSVLYTRLFDSTDGSLVFPRLSYTANTFTAFVLPVLPAGSTDPPRPLRLVVAVVVPVTGPETPSRHSPKATSIEWSA
jgi:membrane protease YdiL (CAAX protease family)